MPNDAFLENLQHDKTDEFWAMLERVLDEDAEGRRMHRLVIFWCWIILRRI